MVESGREAPDRAAYFSRDTIASVVTAVGGPIAIVRLSGPESLYALQRLTTSEDKLKESRFEHKKFIYCFLYDLEGRKIDEALAVVFIAPNSFTGEDCVEFHIHGSSYIIRSLLESLAALGIRQAQRGEFSFRAVRNGKMTLFKAEAVADLIAASNQSSVTLALDKMSGVQNQLLNQITEELRTLATLAEVNIDFSDQDIDEISIARLKQRVVNILKKTEKIIASFSRGIRIQEGVSVAIVGLPNAGKSSFFNALLGEERSIVSELAGTTRDVVHEELTLQGKNNTVTLRLQDMAGLRAQGGQIEEIGIDRAIKKAATSDLILLIVDVLQPVDDLARQWGRLGNVSDRTIGVLSKCDLVAGTDIQKVKNTLLGFNVGTWVETSALTGLGITEVAETICAFCEHWTNIEQGEIILTRLEQVKAMEEAVRHLGRAMGTGEVDLFAADLRQALHSLEGLSGKTLPDDILSRIFSQFCIGK